MTTLQFADTHNLVAFLSKPAESEGFEQIVDFLNINRIKYALTINPTIYTSCIEQFWATIKVKTVNGEVQLQALVDGKKIIITEAAVRRDLQLNDEEGPAQVREITSLKLRVKKLEKKGGSRTYNLKRLYKVGLSRRVKSSDEEVSTHFDADTDMFGVHDLVGDEVVVETEVASKDVNLSVDEVTLAQALAALKCVKPKANKVMLQEPEQGIIATTTAATTVTAASTRPKAKGLVIHKEERATTPTVSSQQPSQVKVQDKGKGKMLEPKKPMKMKELIRLDEEIASKLQAKFDEEVRLAREKAKKEKEANILSYDNVQAMIDVDYQMAQQMQAEEQEKLSIKEKSKLFVQLLEAKKKYFAVMRAQEKRNKPPTKAQKKNTMSTYLKNMAVYKHNQLKNKSFDDIQKLFDKAMKRVNTFIDMETELVEGSKVRAEAEIAHESSSKRADTMELKHVIVLGSFIAQGCLDLI
ncbi:hypothetical protein Tco_0663033 [Tanacetum coccineum]